MTGKEMSVYNQLTKLNLLSWPTLFVGFEKELILKRDLEDYAVSLLKKSDNVEPNITLLADASHYNKDEIQDIIKSQLKSENIIKESEISKLKLAALLSLEESALSDEGKCNKLQELYSDFDYPNDMSGCSIYSTDSTISPLECMHNLIITLKKKFRR